MSLATYTGKAVAVNNALETLTFRSADYINESHILGEDVSHGECVAQFEILRKVCLKLGEFATRGNTRFCEMPLERIAGVLFCCFVIGKLHCFVTIGIHSTQLRNNARTSLDNGAWKILSISTENGSHSDFLSN